ncbi:MAG TPA: hypothetical protein G4O09_06330 [Dehalococcoidia bacterium]|nr:hypothetical protein [Dehalococcoidia bacterium]
MSGNDRYLCEIYLASATQKHLFAERRLRSLRGKITEYKRKSSRIDEHTRSRNYPNRLPIEMDFDHCILSLRSSLEHLAQLVNAVICLGIPATGYHESVSLQRVISKLDKETLVQGYSCLSNLSLYLSKVKNSNWYKELHALRIESFHVKFGRLPRTETMTLGRDLIDLKFLLPNGTVTSKTTEIDRDIFVYCKSIVKDVERVLNNSFQYLSEYLLSKFGDKWLKDSTD